MHSLVNSAAFVLAALQLSSIVSAATVSQSLAITNADLSPDGYTRS